MAMHGLECHARHLSGYLEARWVLIYSLSLSKRPMMSQEDAKYIGPTNYLTMFYLGTTLISSWPLIVCW